MNLLNHITDPYERQARIYPAVLLIAPVIVTVTAFLSARLSALESCAAIAVGCGGAFLLSQLARDAGKKREKVLFEKWTGLPSVAIFRHRDLRLDAITKARYHKKLASLVKGAKAPSSEQEQADPAEADKVYAAWSMYLRTHTRDVEKYPLVFKENVNYGYRRNVWGLRSIGIVLSALCCIGSIGRCYATYGATGQLGVEMVGAMGFDLLLLLLWVFRFSPGWVRIAADAYAERLSEAVDGMTGGTSLEKK